MKTQQPAKWQYAVAWFVLSPNLSPPPKKKFNGPCIQNSGAILEATVLMICSAVGFRFDGTATLCDRIVWDSDVLHSRNISYGNTSSSFRLQLVTQNILHVDTPAGFMELKPTDIYNALHDFWPVEFSNGRRGASH